jgi:DNA-binding IclR family transcriptional regulator
MSDPYASQQGKTERAFRLLGLLVAQGGGASLGSAADALGLPLSTAHRLAALLVRQGLLVRGDRGQYLPGWTIVELARAADWREVLAGVARPFARRMARKSLSTVHVGVLDGDMVTYLVKETGVATDLFTREGMQLEAYCSAVGKILLSDLPDEDLQDYLKGAPFPALTSATITDPVALRGHLREVRERGFAVDDREVAEDLLCFAVPIRKPDGTLLAALSSAGRVGRRSEEKVLSDLRRCAAQITDRLFPRAA